MTSPTTLDRPSYGATDTSDDGSVLVVCPMQFGALLAVPRYVPFPDHIFDPSTYTAMPPFLFCFF